MYEELLARVPLFREFSRRELAWLDAACRERNYASGDVVVRQGGGGVGLLMVVEGSLRLTRHQEHGGELEHGELGPGAVWGEPALLGDAPSMATITALEPTRAAVLPTWEFQSTLREYPDLAIHLLAVVSRQTHQADQGTANA